MSRTFRRKGYEEANMPWKEGTKTAGFYTETDWYSVKNKDGSRNMWANYAAYRKPTRDEHNKAYWSIHSDNHPNAWSPGRWYRNNRMKENRMLTKTELFKYMKNTDYEVMVEANPRSCLWDWS